MLDILLANITHHWILVVYFGTMLFNENAILTAFSLSVGDGGTKYFGIAVVAGLGTLTNDLILYVVARFGLVRFIKRGNNGINPEEKTFFEKIFLRNIFISFLLLKFLFGMRTFLTLYLVVKKRISFPIFLFYNFCAVIFYIIVLAFLGWCIGFGMSNVFGVYNVVGSIVLAIIIVVVFTHFFSYGLQKVRKKRIFSQLFSRQR